MIGNLLYFKYQMMILKIYFSYLPSNERMNVDDQQNDVTSTTNIEFSSDSTMVNQDVLSESDSTAEFSCTFDEDHDMEDTSNSDYNLNLINEDDNNILLIENNLNGTYSSLEFNKSNILSQSDSGLSDDSINEMDFNCILSTEEQDKIVDQLIESYKGNFEISDSINSKSHIHTQ